MKKSLLLINIILIVVAGCNSLSTTTLTNYPEQITFYKNSAKYYPGKQLMRCKLSDTTLISGFKCISWIHFFENGQIKQYQTAALIQRKNYIIPLNSVIFLDELNPEYIKYIYFSEDVTINNVICKGGNKISTAFYENDMLKSCFISGSQDIQGYPCKSSLLKPITFYPDGKIKILTLGRDTTLAGNEFKSGETIIIEKNGAISKYK